MGLNIFSYRCLFLRQINVCNVSKYRLIDSSSCIRCVQFTFIAMSDEERERDRKEDGFSCSLAVIPRQPTSCFSPFSVFPQMYLFLAEVSAFQPLSILFQCCPTVSGDKNVIVAHKQTQGN